MLTKESIQELKITNPDFLGEMLSQTEDSKNLVFILENLGQIPDNFNQNILMNLAQHSQEQIRFLAIKNLAKLADINLLNFFFELAVNDPESLVRREAVSAIGRLRNGETIPFLLQFLTDKDPKIILQAIRGLLVFKNNDIVKQSLIKLADHPNEIIQSVIRKAFTNKKSSPDQLPHPLSPEFMKNVVVNSDVREVFPYIPDQSIHLTFTSPPYYNARDYSIYTSYQAYLDFLCQVFQETHRITKEGRFLVVNTSPIIIPRTSRAHASKRYPISFDLHYYLVNHGWEFIDDIIWLKPESSVKNRNGGFLQHRKPLAYKPNAVTEYLMVYRKETDKLLDWNMKQYDQDIIEESKVCGDYESSNVWRIDPTFDKIHTAVFPIELCNRVIKFYSYKGDLVFDPFGGSGTVGRAARNLGRYFFLTEQESTYVDRMKIDLGQPMLFEPKLTKFLSLAEFLQLSQEQEDDNNH